MWMLEVVVPEDEEAMVDELVGEACLLYQCWGWKEGYGVRLRYAFREPEYAREAEERIQKWKGYTELKVWDEVGFSGDDNEGPTAALIRRIRENDLEAAKEWVANHQTSVMKKDWWYHVFPNGRSRKMSSVEHATQNKALDMVRAQDNKELTMTNCSEEEMSQIVDDYDLLGYLQEALGSEKAATKKFDEMTVEERKTTLVRFKEADPKTNKDQV